MRLSLQTRLLSVIVAGCCCTHRNLRVHFSLSAYRLLIMSNEENGDEREITVERKKTKAGSVVLNRCALDRRLTRHPLTQCLVCTLKFWYGCTFLSRFV